jgi:UDP-glucose-4-epimerase GalE
MTRGTILVSGGAGYIGSHACKALRLAGYLPVTIDNLSTGHASLVKWGPLIEGDIRDGDLVRDTVRHHVPIGTMHFAAMSSVAESVAKPMLYYENNLLGGFAFLKVLLEQKILPFVFSSTAAVYGIPTVSPVPETHETRPISPYGETKLAFEGVLRSLAPQHKLRWAALRYFNAAGADPDGETGECHEPETHLMPNIARAALSGHELQIFGTDYATADGTTVRDYIHVWDLALAHVAVMDHLVQGGDSLVLNVGTTAGTSVLSLIGAAEKILGRKLKTVNQSRRPGDPPILVADATRIRDRLQWRPQFSDVETMMRTSLAWEAKRRAQTIAARQAEVKKLNSAAAH